MRAMGSSRTCLTLVVGLATLVCAARVWAGSSTPAPRAQRRFDHAAHAAALKARTGGTESCAGHCHRVRQTGAWIDSGKQEHARCFGSCHTFATSCGTLRAGAGTVCLSCHVNLAGRCVPPGAHAIAATTPPELPSVYSHKKHVRPGAPTGRQCEGCHGPFGDQKPGQTPAIGHAQCADCHARQADPVMTQCSGCHKPAAALPPPTAPGPYSVRLAFSHRKHAGEARVGTKGKECLTCHDNIASAPDDNTVPLPTMKGCLTSCHNGRTAFSAVGASCTRCHQGGGTGAHPAPAPAAPLRFSHRDHQQRGVNLSNCSTCHTLDADFKVAPATTGKDHQPCARSGCHADQFLSPQPRPAICSVCHEHVEPWTHQVALYRQRKGSEFGGGISHKSHVGARVPGQGGGPNASCVACHGDPYRGSAAPQGHQVCAPCHGHSAKPAMEQCAACHQLGAAAARPVGWNGAWSVAARFDHTTHASDPRSKNQTRCATCHAAVPRAVTLSQIAPPAMTSCDGCHDGRHAFKTTGFACARCHGGKK